MDRHRVPKPALSSRTDTVLMFASFENIAVVQKKLVSGQIPCHLIGFDRCTSLPSGNAIGRLMSQRLAVLDRLWLQ